MGTYYIFSQGEYIFSLGEGWETRQAQEGGGSDCRGRGTGNTISFLLLSFLLRAGRVLWGSPSQFKEREGKEPWSWCVPPLPHPGSSGSWFICALEYRPSNIRLPGKVIDTFWKFNPKPCPNTTAQCTYKPDTMISFFGLTFPLTFGYTRFILYFVFELIGPIVCVIHRQHNKKVLERNQPKER